MKCFVAGGTGVIGRRAVPALVAAGHDVTVIARTPERDQLVEDLGATPVRVDLFDADAVAGAVAGHDAVINLATHIPPMSRGAAKGSWDENDRIRTEGSTNLVAAARRHDVGRVIQESITFPYADGGADWLDEDAPRPPSPFSGPVDHAESEVASFTAGGGAGVVLRFAQFYAPDSSHTRAFARTLRWRISPFVGAPDSYSSFIGMPSAAAAVVAALDCEPGVYNIADDDPPTRRALGEAAAAAIGRRPPFALPAALVRRVNPAADVLMRSHRIDNRRFRAATGWAPEHSGADGVAAAIAEIVAR